jgi:hypothetical protein
VARGSAAEAGGSERLTLSMVDEPTSVASVPAEIVDGGVLDPIAARLVEAAVLMESRSRARVAVAGVAVAGR